MLASRWVESRFRGPADTTFLADPADVEKFHETLPGYAPTPLHALPALARELGVGAIWVKDEGQRFGLNAFKGLGASYAIHRYLAAHPPKGKLTFATATDGNHGRAVAWSAKRLGHDAVIYVPRNTVAARIEAIRGEGARCEVIDGNYDETVKRAAADAAKHGWQVISDTSWQGYTEIPAWIMSGYATLFRESITQLAGTVPTSIFLQAGVGGMAIAGLAVAAPLTPRPKLICVEPLDADCLAESAATSDGRIAEAKGKQDSIMAGLNCGTPSLLAWPALRAGLDGFLAVDDGWAADAMRRLARPQAGDPKIVAGESGAAGLAGLLALCKEPALAGARKALGLDGSARVLLINTEGDTDPVNYERIVGAA